jgi:hypothetical protein
MSALSLEQFGLWPRAQEMFFHAMSRAHLRLEGQAQSMAGTEDPFTQRQSSERLAPVPDLEARLWEEEWLHCAKQVCSNSSPCPPDCPSP